MWSTGHAKSKTKISKHCRIRGYTALNKSTFITLFYCMQCKSTICYIYKQSPWYREQGCPSVAQYFAFLCFFFSSLVLFSIFGQSGEICPIFSGVLDMLKMTGNCTIWGQKWQKKFLGEDPQTPLLQEWPLLHAPIATVHQGMLYFAYRIALRQHWLVQWQNEPWTPLENFKQPLFRTIRSSGISIFPIWIHSHTVFCYLICRYLEHFLAIWDKILKANNLFQNGSKDKYCPIKKKIEKKRKWKNVSRKTEKLWYKH